MTIKGLIIGIICAAIMSTNASEISTEAEIKTASACESTAKSHARDEIQMIEATMNPQINNISVSCFRVTWDAINEHTYEISCVNPGNIQTPYAANVCCEIRENGLAYITGLRENTAYIVTIHDKTINKCESIIAITDNVVILEEYDYIDGNTDCFAYEAASGLTRNPSKDAISEAIVDPVTYTGIMRNEYGDYCVAMGLYFGECGDRFLIELENGVHFTVQICDSKGYGSDGEGKYHTFGDDESGKCIIEFIHGGSVPPEIRNSGNYSTLDWCGLKLDKVKHIWRIESVAQKVQY